MTNLPSFRFYPRSTVPTTLPHLWYGRPAPLAVEALGRLPWLPDDSGRLGVLCAVRGDEALALLHFAPESAPPVDGLPAAEHLVGTLPEALFEDAARRIRLVPASGAETDLFTLAEAIKAQKPKRIARGGGAGLNLTHEHWNRALLDAAASPSVTLWSGFFARFAAEGWRAAAYLEVWCGAPVPGDVKFPGMPLSPKTTVKPLLERILEGFPMAADPRFSDPAAAALRPEIVEETRDWVVVLKPSQLLSVPGALGLPDAMTLASREIGAPLVPVHRLDMDTSGLLVYAKSESGTKALMAAFRDRRVTKRYAARVLGAVEGGEGRIEFPLTTNPLDRLRQIAALGGRPSVTQWKRAGEPFPGADGMPRTDLILTPVTGRTHQLRLHCAHSAGLGAPIEGDPYYSPAGLAAESPETPLLLHAGLLDFEDPASGRRVRFFRAPAFRPDLQERDFDR